MHSGRARGSNSWRFQIDGLSYYGVSESNVLLVYSKVDVCAVTASSTTKTTITMVPFPPPKGTSTSEGKSQYETFPGHA